MTSEVATEARKAGSKKPVVLIAAVGVTVVLVAGLWASGVISYLIGRSPKSSSSITVEQSVLVDLPDIVSNLDTGGHRASFVKLHAKIKVARAADGITIQANLPQILDIFQTYLRSTRPDEIRGGEGTYRLREALMSRIDASVAPVQVSDLFFTELLVQ